MDHFKIRKIAESSEYTKVFHSATSDMYALYKIGINVKPPYDDTFIMSSIIDENFSSHKLKDLAKRYLDEPCKEQKELNKIKLKYKRKLGKDFTWDKIPKEIIEPYAVKDAEYTRGLYHYFLPKLSRCKDLYAMEIDLIPEILSMMIRGHKINRNFCENEIKNMKDVLRYYYNKLIRINGAIFNIQSPKELRIFLKKTGIDFKERTRTGLIKTDKSILQPLAKTNFSIRYILNCRSAMKQISTYYEPLLHNYTSKNDPIAHFSFWQSGTKSGRFSAELIQTIPKSHESFGVRNNVRKAFVPRDGFVNVYFDYDQIEMRLFADFTDNQSLLQSIRDGKDVHTTTAIDLFDEYETNPKHYRRIAKTINFGMIYGMGTDALAASLEIPKYEAHAILAKYDHMYRIKSFIGKTTSLLCRQGFISLDWIDRDYHVPKKLAYKAVNIRIQGSASYIIKLAMIRLKVLKKMYPGRVNLLLQIHDELVFEIHKSLPIKKTILEIKKLMEDHTTFKVPITTSVKYSDKSWGDKKEWKL